MVIFKDSPENTKKISPKEVEGLASKILGLGLVGISHRINTDGQYSLRISGSPQSPIADIYYPNDPSMRLYNPLYIQEAVRFAQAYEHSFLSNPSSNREFTIQRTF